MAKIIFQPTGLIPGSGVNALILEPREALIYPFSFDGKWNNLFVSMFFQWVGVNTSGDNSPPPVSQSLPTNDRRNGIIFGFTTKDDPFPSGKNNVFYGYSFNATFPNFYLHQNSLQNYGIIISSGSSFNEMGSYVHYAYGSDPTGYIVSGEQFIANSISVGINLGESGKYLTGFYYSNSNFSKNKKINTNLMREIENSNAPANIIQYLTHDKTSSGIPYYHKPDSFIIYSPFHYARLKIYNFGLFKIE